MDLRRADGEARSREAHEPARRRVARPVRLARPRGEEEHRAQHRAGRADAERYRRKVPELLGRVEVALELARANAVRAVILQVFVLLHREDPENTARRERGGADAPRHVGSRAIGCALG
jgi:hypothetical protein